jgi:hypothetical protein
MLGVGRWLTAAREYVGMGSPLAMRLPMLRQMRAGAVETAFLHRNRQVEAGRIGAVGKLSGKCQREGTDSSTGRAARGSRWVFCERERSVIPIGKGRPPGSMSAAGASVPKVENAPQAPSEDREWHPQAGGVWSAWEAARCSSYREPTQCSEDTARPDSNDGAEDDGPR